MSAHRVLIAAIAFCAVTAAPCSAGKYKDWSGRGPEFHILAPLRIKARDVKYVGPATIEMYGAKLEASRFEVIADILVQIRESYATGGDYATARAKYELIVGNDSTFEIHDRMIEEIRAFWSSKNKSDLEDYGGLPGDKSLFYKDGAYVLYEKAATAVDSDTLWLDGKVVRGRCVDIIKGGVTGDGQEQLMEEVLRYRVNGRTIKSDYKSDFPPEEFLKLYAKGAFKNK